MKNKKLLMLIPIVTLLASCGGSKETTPEADPNENTGENTGKITGDHTFLPGWDKDENYHWHYCEEPGCEEMSDKATHTFEWAITKEASYEAKGVKSYRCKVCGYVKEKEEIEKLVHSYNTSSWSHDSKHHWHGCSDEGYEDKVFGKDFEEHTITGGTPEVEPTYSQVGHTAGGKCSVCNAEIQSFEIPVLNETNYVKKVTKEFNILTEMWVLKDPDVINRDEYVVTKAYHYGWIVIDDYSTGKMVTTDYNYYDFNQKFPGVEISIDEKTRTTTINVTKPGGYTFNNVAFVFPTSDTVEAGKFIFTGEPLTINAPEGLEDPALLFSCSDTVKYMSSVVINNDLTLNYSSKYTTESKGYGIKERTLTINSGAKLTINGFANGIIAHYAPITVNGALDINVKKLAIVSSSTSKNRTIKIPATSTFYFDGVAQESATSTDTDTIKTKNVKHFEVIPA